MKVSLLIQQLQKAVAEYGDLEVDLWQDEADEAGTVGGLSIFMNDEDKAESITIAGPETMLAFDSADPEEVQH